jgi:hypothetical protein
MTDVPGDFGDEKELWELGAGTVRVNVMAGVVRSKWATGRLVWKALEAKIAKIPHH